MLTTNEHSLLNNIYSDLKSEAAFTNSPSKLINIADKQLGYDGFTLAQGEHFLKSIDTHTLFKQIPTRYRKRNYRPFIIGSVNEQWQADLADMSRHNLFHSPRYLLCVIDAFSKYAFVRGIPSKHGKVVADAFKDIFSKSLSHPEFICTDFGTEFINATVKQTLFSFGVKRIFQTTGNNKAAIVERFISTLRMIISKFLFHNGLKQLNNHNLQLIVENYNNRKHSATGYKPVDIWFSKKKLLNQESILLDNNLIHCKTSREDPAIWLQAFKSLQKNWTKRMKKAKKSKFKVGDVVRISRSHTLFNSRINNPTFTSELYTISRVHSPVHKNDVITYNLKFLNSKSNKWEPVKGKFYQHELVESIKSR